FFSSRRRHTRSKRDWSSDVCSSDLLYHLMRGGRVSRSTAVVGTMLSIKPLIQMNDEGKLIPTGKAHGRKKGMKALIDMMDRQMRSEERRVGKESRDGRETDA